MTADPQDVRITEARWPEDRTVVAGLFRDYVNSLAEDISFQNVDGEIAGLPGPYARPGGVALIAWRAGEPAGAVACRPIEPDLCEMKRLYVRPGFRGSRIGQRLVEELIRDARIAGHRRMLLDTLASMRSARALYASLGFRPIPPYYDNPLPGVTYMALDL